MYKLIIVCTVFNINSTTLSTPRHTNHYCVGGLEPSASSSSGGSWHNIHRDFHCSQHKLNYGNHNIVHTLDSRGCNWNISYAYYKYEAQFPLATYVHAYNTIVNMNSTTRTAYLTRGELNWNCVSSGTSFWIGWKLARLATVFNYSYTWEVLHTGSHAFAHASAMCTQLHVCSK